MKSKFLLTMILSLFFVTGAGSLNAQNVAKIGDTEYATLQAAVGAAIDGQTITMINNAELTETVTIPADKTVTLDLNGKTVSQEKECTAHYEMIKNRGSLTITDNTEEANGKVSFKDKGAGDASFGWGSYTIANYGTLVVENGKIEHLGEQNTPGNVIHMYSAIQQGHPAASTTINGGIISTPTYRSVRTNTGALIINGGVFEGQVWIQPNQGNSTLVVTGGSFAPKGGDGSSIFMTNEGENYTITTAAITGGYFATKIGATNAEKEGVKGCISGGIFTESAKTNTNANLIAEGYIYVANGDGTYTVSKEPEEVTTEEELVTAIANAATNGGTIVIANNIEVTNTIVIPANNAKSESEEIILDLNGKTISKTFTENKADDLIVNKGSLVITDNTETKTGKVTYKYTGQPDSNYTYDNATIQNEGTLTILAGIVENTTQKMSHASYAINTNAGATLNIEGGKVLNLNGHAIRMVSFGTAQNTVNVSGGYIEGTRALQVQLPGSASSPSKPAMDINISGGELKSNEDTYNLAIYVYSNGQSAENLINLEISGDVIINGNVALNAAATNTMQANTAIVSGGTINGAYGIFSYADDNDHTQSVIEITGGTFATNYSAWYAYDDGFIFDENTDGTYSVVEDPNVAQIGETTYTTLEAAFDAAQDGDEIVVLKDIILPATSDNAAFVIASTIGNVTLNLNAFDITSSERIGYPGRTNYAFDNYANLTIKGKGTITARGIQNYGTLTIEGNDVTIISNDELVGNGACIWGYQGSATIIKGGTFRGLAKGAGAINTEGSLEITGGTFSADGKQDEGYHVYTIQCKGNNTVNTISGATLSSGRHGVIVVQNGAELTINNVEATREGVPGQSGHVLYVADNGMLTINGGTFVNEDASAGSSVIYTNANSTTYVTDGTFTNQGDANVISGAGTTTLTGGNYSKDVTNYCAAGYISQQNESGRWDVVINPEITGEAMVNGIGYETLEAALEAAQTGDEVVLLKNVSLSSSVSVAGKNITLNLNGKTITANFSDSYGAIYVKKGAELTIKGEGNITSTGIVIGTYGTVNIQGGNITTTNANVEESTALYVFYYSSDFEGVANISGGRLNRVWNCGTLNITGGIIDYLDTSSELTIGADAEITTMIAKDGADADGPYEMQIADINVIENITLEEGYILVEVGEDVYQVVPNNAEALIGTTSYSTLEDAIAAANADDDEDEVVLLKDVTIESKIDVTESLVLNGNNKTLTYTGSDRAIDVRKETDGANLTVRNLTINCAANWCERGINYNTTGTLTLDGVTIEGKTIKSINYGVNFPGYADGATAFIENSKITNFMPINIWGSNMNVTITDSEIYSYSTSNDAGGGIVLNIDAEHSAEGTQVYMIGGKLHAYFIDDENNYTPGYAVRKEVNNTTLVSISNTTDVYGSIENGLTVATVRYGDSPYFYSYETLKDAVEKAILDYSNGITNVRVEVVKDAEGSGIFIEKDLNLNLTIDFKNHTYTFTEPAVGSTGTVSQGFHIEKGNKITLKNGTLNVHTDYDRLYAMLIQNYADLTIIDMTLDGDNLDRYKDKDYNYSYVLSNNCGTVNISGNTNIIANPGDEGENHHGVAFDVCKYANYEAPVVTVNTTGIIKGVVEVSAVLNLEAVGTNNISRIDISGEGQLYHNVEGIQGTIKRTFENNANDNPEDDWYTIAVPFAGHEVSALQTTTDYALYRYNESAALWENVKVSDNNFLTLDLGRGYIYANAATTDFEFSGEFNVKPVTYTLTLQSQVEDLKGFHLIGNPFAHDITMSHLTGKTLADGFYVLSNDGAWSAKSSLDKIAAGQGALIKTTEEGALTIVKNVSSKSREVNNGQLMINVANSRYNDVAYVSFNKGIGLNKIAHRNAEIPMVYVPVNGENYAVATMSNEVTEIPVSFEAKTMGEYTISVEAQDCEFAQMYLIDKMTGYSTNLLLEDYTFMAKSGDNAERFVIRLVNSFDHSFGAENFIIFNDEEMMINDIQGEGVIRIVDVLGRPVAEYNVFGSANISTTSFRSGAYMIQVIDESGVKVQKIIID